MARKRYVTIKYYDVDYLTDGGFCYRTTLGVPQDKVKFLKSWYGSKNIRATYSHSVKEAY
jgi:hypothetical protein